MNVFSIGGQMTELSRIEFDTSQALRVAEAFKQAPELSTREFSTAVTEAVLLLEREVKDKTETGATGLLGRSITHQVRGSSEGVYGKVVSPLQYAIPVELGTKPHFPPLDALEDWVHFKFDLPRAEARGVAYIIARKIAAKGTEGRFMFTDTMSERGGDVLRLLSDALDRVFAQMGSV